MQFTETYKCLSNQINYHGTDMKYKTWLKKQPDLKAAFLYVNFYQAVQSAWQKKKQFEYIDEAEAVSLCLQYLQKNVKKMEQDEKRYTSSYVHVVCMNCLSSLHWRKCDRKRYENETSTTVFTAEGEFDLTSVMASNHVEHYNTPEFEYGCKDTLGFVHNCMGLRYEKLAYCLINNSSTRKVSKSNRNFNSNPFSKVGIKDSEKVVMLFVLKCALQKYVSENRPDLVSYLT